MIARQRVKEKGWWGEKMEGSGVEKIEGEKLGKRLS